MSRAFRCDICEGFYFYENGEHPNRDYHVMKNIPGKYESTLDICPSCYKKLTDWIKRGKNDEKNQSSDTDNIVNNSCDRSGSNSLYGSQRDTGSGEKEEESAGE